MGNSDYTTLRTASGRARGARDLPVPLLEELLRRPEDLLWRHIDRSVKIDHGSLIVEAELPLAGGNLRVAYKRYRARNWWKAFVNRFRRSRARRGWNLGHALIGRRIATARPVAMLEPRGGCRRGQSYLATEWIENAENLHLWGWRLADCENRLRLRLAAICAESLGRLIGRMHATGISNRDLKAANLLVAGRCDRLATYLIDTDGMKIRRRLSASRRAADLARLAVGLQAHAWVSRSVCWRFVRAYVTEFPQGTAAAKPLWRDVVRHGHRIIRRKHRQGERVL